MTNTASKSGVFTPGVITMLFLIGVCYALTVFSVVREPSTKSVLMAALFTLANLILLVVMRVSHKMVLKSRMGAE